MPQTNYYKYSGGFGDLDYIRIIQTKTKIVYTRIWKDGEDLYEANKVVANTSNNKYLLENTAKEYEPCTETTFNDMLAKVKGLYFIAKTDRK